MSNERQINYVNNLQNRAQNLYYVDNASELNSINLKENDKIYAINDNKLFQMEIADQEEELSGAIVNFNGRNNTKVEELTVAVEPVQDLHGYDSPWPAGGGKNLVGLNTSPVRAQILTSVAASEQTDEKVTLVSSSATYACLRLFYHVKAGTYTINFSATSSDSFNPVVSIYNYASPYNLLAADIAAGTPRTITLSQDHDIDIRFFATTSTAAVRTVTFSNFQLESGSAATAFSTYSNICPISGRTSATVMRTGRNLLSLSVAELGGTNPRTIRVSIGTIPPGTYCFSAVKSGTATGNFGIQFLDSGSKIAGQVNSVLQNVTLTAPAVRAYAYMASGDYSDGKTLVLSDMQLEVGSTASAYEPYQGDTYTIALGDTVYGGTLDVTQGKMVVDRALYQPTGNENNYQQQTGRITFALPTAYRVLGTTERVCSAFHVLTASTYCYVYTGMTIDELKSYFQQNDVQIVVGLATPIEITLTPTQIKTLLGTNNIWSDAGNVSVGYRADTKLYIQKNNEGTDRKYYAKIRLAYSGATSRTRITLPYDTVAGVYRVTNVCSVSAGAAVALGVTDNTTSGTIAANSSAYLKMPVGDASSSAGKQIIFVVYPGAANSGEFTITIERTSVTDDVTNVDIDFQTIVILTQPPKVTCASSVSLVSSSVRWHQAV